MSRIRRYRLLRAGLLSCACSISLCLLAVGRAHAASGFVLRSDAIASTGGFSGSSVGKLGMTIGQPVTGAAFAGGAIGEFVGFWRPFPAPPTVGVADDVIPTSEVRFALHAPIPNPAPGAAAIRYAIPGAGPGRVRVSIRVHDLAGRVVRVLVSGAVEPGVHTVSWNGLDGTGARCGAGIYFIELVAGSMRSVRRMALLH